MTIDFVDGTPYSHADRAHVVSADIAAGPGLASLER
jgi:hypothetical protein